MDETEREAVRRLLVAAQDVRNMLVDGVTYGERTLWVGPGEADEPWIARLDVALGAVAGAIGCDVDLSPIHDPLPEDVVEHHHARYVELGADAHAISLIVGYPHEEHRFHLSLDQARHLSERLRTARRTITRMGRRAER